MTTRRSSIALPEESKSELVEVLDEIISATVALYLRTKTAHWNVKGERFFQLHQLFDTVAESIEPYVDSVSERVAQLGEPVFSALPSFAAKAQGGSTATEGDPNEKYYIENVREGLDTLSRLLRQGIDRANAVNDAGTSDLLTDFIRDTEKSLWFVEAHQLE